MKNSTFNFMSVLLMSVFILFSACKKDKDPDKDPDNNKPTLVYNETIIGMTGVTSRIEIAATDPDGDELSFTWTIITSPVGSSPALTQQVSRADFITTTPGIYKVEVLVKDNKGSQAIATVNLYIGGELPANINSNTILPDLFADEAYPDYYATRSVQITAGLTLDPGVVIECASDVTIFANGSNAYLSAGGSASKNIIFRGSEQIKGWWKTINFNSVNLNNKLDHVQVLHAGSSNIAGYKAAVYINSNSSNRATITNTRISMTDGYGLFIDGNSNGLIEFSGNEFSDNTAAPMMLGAENLYSLDNASIFTGNGIQAIVVKATGNGNARFNSAGSIKALGVDYHFMSSAELQTKLTFEPGVVCLFNSGTRMWVTAAGAIIANGNASEKITFSGITSSPGAWNGIELASSSPENSIDHAIISYGGNSSGRKANIYMFNPSKLTLTNSTISDSQTWGVFKAPGSIDLTESNNTFINNASGDIGGNI
ncbi:MAG: hypothetical protein CVT94_04935 [Bacteroidetes bacterium HGW-Bacteroidetes-11]|jgi:hypothetical protein|nr:MAG: hypothetical protein CVT94_04935 [Bacteroidetes bacterium HGW-Bacteroidetes-11]